MSYEIEVSDKTAVNMRFSVSSISVKHGSSSISVPTLSGHNTGSGAGCDKLYLKQQHGGVSGCFPVES